MMNIYDSQTKDGNYCAGGDFVPAMNQALRDGTFELESNFPYSNWEQELPKHNLYQPFYYTS